MKYILVLLFLVGGCLAAIAQNPQTTHLHWSVTQLTDLNTNKPQSYTCSFETNGLQPINWIQKSGAFITLLSVEATSGSWTDINNPGVLTYSIQTDDSSGTLTFERSGSGYNITIDLSLPGGQRLHNRYTVSSVNQIN